MLQLKEIPPRPAEFDGALCLFGVVAGVTEDMLAAYFSEFGDVQRIETDGPLRQTHGVVVVRFLTHEAALEAKRAEAPPNMYGGADTLYNDRSYDGRSGEVGREDDDGRGWCAPPHRDCLCVLAWCVLETTACGTAGASLSLRAAAS